MFKVHVSLQFYALFGLMDMVGIKPNYLAH